ncbi:DUF6090 family protein [Robiginitalea sp. IMCC43444]|uniref:DUF6090 family protein n=1 Tax=Robiginitalea sp. IMCC43444 TaxID=3459121 RepID=UPI004041EA32
MIKFFRRIRQRLLSENKFRNYFLYAVGEIVLVVIGILIALKINNWNEEQKTESKVQDYYALLLEDLNSDTSFARTTIEEYSKDIKAYEAYTDSYHKEKLSPEQVYRELFKLNMISKPLTFNTSTIESLQNSGEIGLIPSNIRNRLIDLRRLQNLTIQRFEDTDDGKSEITQNISLLIGSTTLPARLQEQNELAVFLNIEQNLRQMILVYEGIHRWKSITEREALGRLEHMLVEIDTIKALIDKELKR